MMTVPDELIQLADTGLAVIVGTRDSRNVPEMCRAWGLRILDDGSALELCIPAGSGARVLENVAATGAVAVTLVQPTTYRSYQVKGSGSVAGEASAEDLQHVARHKREFLDEVEAVGMVGPGVAHLFDSEHIPGLTKIRIAVESVFDQTPGPGAGARL